MLFKITGKHFEVTEPIRDYAEQKTLKLPRYYSSLTQIEVIIAGNRGKSSSVEVIARAEHNNIFVAKENGEDTYACIDAAVHKLERQLKKKKGKERDNKR